MAAVLTGRFINSVSILLCLLGGLSCATAPFPESPPEPPADDERLFTFEGVVEGSESDLMKLVERDERRYRERPRVSVIDDVVFRTFRYYRVRGYANVHVEHEKRGEKVVFKIDEGAVILLGRVHFQGNSAIDDEELERVRPFTLPGKSQPYSDQVVALMTSGIIAAYRAKGFVDVTVSHPVESHQENRVNVTFHVTEGKQYRISAIEGVTKDLADQLELAEKPYTTQAEAQAEAAIVDHYREKGYPFVRAVVTAEIDVEAGRVELLAKVEDVESPVKLGDVHPSGNVRTRDSFVRRRTGLSRDERYNPERLREAEKRLLETGLFRIARVQPGPLDDEKQLTVDVQLEEREPGEISVLAGYGTLDGPRTGAGIAYKNLFGGTELVAARGLVSRLGYRVEVEAAIDYCLGSDFRPGSTAYLEDREYPSYEVTSWGGGGNLLYRFTDGVQATVGASYAVIRTDEVEPNVPEGDLLDFDYRALSLSASWNLLDDPIIPTQGVYVSGAVIWSDKEFDSDTQFVSTEGRVSGYVPLPWDVVFAASIKGGRIRPIDDTNLIPISLRKFAGGTSTVRGFEALTLGPKVNGDPTGGELFAALQAEVRFPIWSDLHGAVFGDRGGVWFRTNDFDFDDTRYAAGVGLRYHTTAGALVADLAWNPDPIRDDGEELFVLHVSVGFPF